MHFSRRLVARAAFSSLALSVIAAFSAHSALAEVRTLEFRGGDRYLVVDVLSDELLHFEVGQKGSPYKAANPRKTGEIWLSPLIAPQTFPGPTILRQEGGFRFKTAYLTVEVVPDSLCATIYDERKQPTFLTNVCASNLDQPWKELRLDSRNSTHAYGLGQYFWNTNDADGDWVGRVWDPLASTHGNTMRAFSHGANTYSLFPILYALGNGKHGFAFMMNHVYKQMWSLDQRPWKIGTFGDQLRFLVLAGQDLPDLRKKYMDLTGKPPVPPKKALGLWVSEFGYDNWAEIDGELTELERKDIPVEGFALDIQWFGAEFFDTSQSKEAHEYRKRSRFGSLQFGDNFLNPESEIQKLARRGASLMAIEESYVSFFRPEHEKLWKRSGLAKDCGTNNSTYLNSNPWWGEGGMIDWTNPGAGDYWHDDKRMPLMRLGINFHWTDLGEPEMYSDGSCYYGFPELDKHGHADIHNIFNSRWLESIARGYERNHVRERPFMMSRAGNAGLQRFGAGMWSGDIGSNFGALRAHLNSQMHMSLSGIDYYGADIGGFHRRFEGLGGDENDHPLTRWNILYTQWLANASVFDFPIRPHTWAIKKGDPSEGAWWKGQWVVKPLETSPAKMGDVASNRENIRQRYELTPYYYSLAHRAYRFGEPVIPPLVYAFQEDPAVRKVGGEKMVGPSLLAAVVAEYKQVDREVYLPRGKWVNFHSGDWFSSSGETIRGIPAYQDGRFRIPLFAKAGAILPMRYLDAGTRNTFGLRLDGRQNTPDLRVRVYASTERTSFTLFEDDGKTTDYKSGKVATTEIEQVQSGDRLTVRVGATSGTYEGAPSARPIVVEAVLENRATQEVWVDSKKARACEGRFDDLPCWDSPVNSRVHVIIGSRPVSQGAKVEIRSEAMTFGSGSAYFVCSNANTARGDSIYVVGNVPVLGSWNPARAVKLDPTAYPTWTRTIPGLPPGVDIEWRCISRTEDFGPGRGKVHAETRNDKFRTSNLGFQGAHGIGF